MAGRIALNAEPSGFRRDSVIVRGRACRKKSEGGGTTGRFNRIHMYASAYTCSSNNRVGRTGASDCLDVTCRFGWRFIVLPFCIPGHIALASLPPGASCLRVPCLGIALVRMALGMDGDCQPEDLEVASKFAPVTLVDGVGVLGGFLKKPAFVLCERVGGEAFLKINKRESWLCHAAAGKAAGCAPLARRTLFDDMATLVQRAAAAVPLQAPPPSPDRSDAMAGFGLDDDLPAARPPKNSMGAAKAKLGPRVVEVILPPRLRGSGDQQSVRCLDGKVRSGTNGFYIHLDAVGWVIETLGRQVVGGGVEFVPPETKLAQPFFASRDHSWVARARHPNGERVRKALKVPLSIITGQGTKRNLSTAEYKELKHVKLQEIREWQANVQKTNQKTPHTHTETTTKRTGNQSGRPASRPGTRRGSRAAGRREPQGSEPDIALAS